MCLWKVMAKGKYVNNPVFSLFIFVGYFKLSTLGNFYLYSHLGVIDWILLINNEIFEQEVFLLYPLLKYHEI